MNADLLRRVARAVSLSLASLCAPALAADATPRIQASGFATLGAVTTDRDDMWFTRYGVNYPGSSDPDFSPDSLLGLQASVRLTAYNDVTVQALVMEDGERSYDPRLTLAFFRQALAPGLSLRVGRLRVPFFMLSDSLHVNYAHPWVRPPVEVYGLNPFNDLDGIDVIHHARVRGFDVELHPFYGRGRVPFPMGKAELKSIWGVNLAISRGDVALHFGHSQGRFSMVRGDRQTTFVMSELARAGLADVASDLSGTRGRTAFHSVGLQWDDGVWQLVSEVARRHANRYASSSTGWYVSAGRRIGSVTPYVVLARQRLDRHLASAAVPSALDADWAFFLAARNNAQRSVTVGARWDVARFAALKTELTYARLESDAWGSYYPRDESAARGMAGRAANTLSVSLDLTF